MAKAREAIFEERRKLREEYGILFESVAALLFKHDPVGINFDHNTDEYESEAGTILPRLNTCRSQRMCCLLSTRNLCAGSMKALPVLKNVITKLPRRFGNSGRHELSR